MVCQDSSPPALYPKHQRLRLAGSSSASEMIDTQEERRKALSPESINPQLCNRQRSNPLFEWRKVWN